MTVKSLYPTSAEISVTASARLTVRGRSGTLPGLRPFKIRVFEPPDFRMRDGYPVEVPSIDIRAAGMVSATGTRIAFRPNARDIETGANVRWVADSDMFDDVAGSWLPIKSDLGPITWLSSGRWVPTLISDYTYSINKERFTVAAMNFDHDQAEHMWATAYSLTGSAGFTVIMVCSMNSVYGSSGITNFAALFGSGKPTDKEGTLDNQVTDPFEIRLTANAIRVVTDRNAQAVGVANLMGRTAPMYLVFALGRPSSVVYAGSGPTSMTSAEVQTGSSDQRYYGDLVLGRSYGDTLHTPDMALMDFNIYADKLTPDRVRTEVAKLSSVYGGEG